MTGGKKQLNNLEEWVKSIDTKLDNHLVHVAADISEIRADLGWVKKTYWLIAGVSVTAIGGAFFGLIFK